MPNLTISRIYRPLDKTLGLAGLRNKSRPRTAKQRLAHANIEKERRKRCAHCSSSDLEVAVFSMRCAHRIPVLFGECSFRRSDEEEPRAEAPKRQKKGVEAEKPQRKRSR